jgi:hypothetical protein
MFRAMNLVNDTAGFCGAGVTSRGAASAKPERPGAGHSGGEAGVRDPEPGAPGRPAATGRRVRRVGAGFLPRRSAGGMSCYRRSLALRFALYIDR